MSDTSARKTGPVAFEGIIPILAVRALAVSTAYYTGVLGFKVDWQEPGIIASVSRGPCRIFLCEGDQGRSGTWLWVGVSDVETLFREYVSNGATVRHPPTNYQWAYEMQIEDPDGHVLRFGSEPKPGQPVGEWLDMRGDAWIQSGSGGWSKVTSG